MLILFDGTFVVADSGIYVGLANDILNYGEIYPVINNVLPNISRMPIYPHFIALIFKYVGNEEYVIAIVQAFLSAATVISITLIAAAIRPSLILPTAIFSSIWPNLVVYSSLILTDTLFVFFFSWGLCCCIWSFSSKHLYKLITLSGLFFGLALMTRPTLILFPVILFLFLIYVFNFYRRINWRKSSFIALIPVVLMIMSVLPRLYQTQQLYNKPVVTLQMGEQTLYWIYPCLKITWCNKVDRENINNESEILVRKKIDGLEISKQENPAIINSIKRDIGISKIKSLSLSKIATGFSTGSVTSLFHTSFSTIANQFGLKRDSIMNSKYGDSAYEKISNFGKMFNKNNFSIVWLIALATLCLSRVIQLFGLIRLFFDSEIRTKMGFMLISGIYFLIINGPIGDAKYRLPMEPMLIILFVFGLVEIRRIIHKKRQVVE